MLTFKVFGRQNTSEPFVWVATTQTYELAQKVADALNTGPGWTTEIVSPDTPVPENTPDIWGATYSGKQ